MSIKKLFPLLPIIVIYSLIVFSPFLLKNNIYERNDLDEITFSLLYIKNTLVTKGEIPLWNPFANQGIPISADPLMTIFNPILGIPFFIFDLTNAIKISYLLVIILSACSMYYTSRKLGVNPIISLICGLTFASSGYVASRMVAAHFLVLDYPVLPLFFLTIITMLERKHIIWSVLLAMILTLMLFSADVYNLLYAGIILSVVFIYAFLKKKLLRHFFLSFFFFFLFSAIKILPLIELSEYLTKSKEPFVGSQNLVSIFYYIFFPIKPFFELLNIDQFISKDFAWWEKIAFVGPFPFIAICLFIFYRKIFKKIKYTVLLLLLLITLLAISMPSSPLNPLHYAVRYIAILQNFHVPSRVFAMLITLILIIAAITINTLVKQSTFKKYKNTIYICIFLNLLLTSALFVGTFLYKSQPQSNPYFTTLLSRLHKKDSSIYYIAQRQSQSPIPRYIATQNEQKMLQNYAVQLKDSPAEKYIRYDYEQTRSYNDIQPKYFVMEGILQNEDSSVVLVEKYKNVTVYKNKAYTPYAYIVNKDGQKREVELYSQNMGTNWISVNITAEKNNTSTLTLLESYYPGWKAYIDGKEHKLIEDRFLTIPVIEGKHMYTFTFSSQLFKVGAAISIISLAAIVLLCVKYWLPAIRRELALTPS